MDTANNERFSPVTLARAAGVFYLLNFVSGSIALFIRGSAGTAVNLFASATYVVVTILLYVLFKPVSRSLSAVAAVFSLAGCVVGAISALHLARIPVNPLAFFGVYCLLLGLLIIRSTFIPRIIGILLLFGGAGWLTFAVPPLVKLLTPFNLFPGILTEGILTVWLLVRGVDSEMWRTRAIASGGSSPPSSLPRADLI